MSVNSADDVVIYHNPRCSKSRATLALLEERGIEPRVIRYLDEPLTKEQLKTVIDKLGITPWELLRRKEAVFESLNLTADSADDRILEAMVQHPVLIERPIVVTASGAAIGRPPENVESLLAG